MSKMTDFIIKTAKRLSIKDFIVFTLLVIMFFFAASEVLGRLGYELQEIANWDTGLYYTVGKGIVHGIPPYSGLYEMKPPMIFLVSAISYKLSGGFYLVNIFTTILFLLIIFAPTAAFSIKAYKEKSRSSAYAAIAYFAMSLALMCYAELRSGEVQIEALGTAILLSSFSFMTFTYDRNVKIYDKNIIIGGILLGVATMFKEPFGFIGAICLLFFIRTPKDMLTKFVFPILYCFGTCIIILLCSRGFAPYFSVYLASMFGGHLSVYGSPFDRAKNIMRLFDDVQNYSHCLEAFIIVLIGLNSIICFDTKSDSAGIKKYAYPLFKIFRLLLLLWTASFTVGLGGQYYNHHHIFALPCYIILFYSFYCETSIAKEKSIPHSLYEKIWFPIAVCSLILATICFYNRDAYESDKYVPLAVENAKEGAAYVDKVLDALHEENYLYLGFNGHEFYAYTEHLPIGPSFAQWHEHFSTRDTYFSKEFAKQFKKANVIVQKSYGMGAISNEVRDAVRRCFTARAPDAVYQIERPASFKYTLLFRTENNCRFME